jgi:hypothetical protein
LRPLRDPPGADQDRGAKQLFLPPLPVIKAPLTCLPRMMEEDHHRGGD